MDVAGARLVCFSGAGFTDELRDAAERTGTDASDAVVLVELERLYPGA